MANHLRCSREVLLTHLERDVVRRVGVLTDHRDRDTHSLEPGGKEAAQGTPSQYMHPVHAGPGVQPHQHSTTGHIISHFWRRSRCIIRYLVALLFKTPPISGLRRPWRLSRGIGLAEGLAPKFLGLSLLVSNSPGQ
jgi:hypothetical protein